METGAHNKCRIMADNDLIKQHGRGKFSLKSERVATLKDFLDLDCAPPVEIKPKKLKRKQREENCVELFAAEYPDHYSWLMNASSRGNQFAQSLLGQLRKGWMLTVKQMAAIEKTISNNERPTKTPAWH